VPKDGAWFRFLFEGTTFIVKLNVSWSNNGSKATYLLQVKQLADGSGCGSRPIRWLFLNVMMRNMMLHPSLRGCRVRILPARLRVC